MSEFEYPETVGKQDTPIELVDFSLEGEPREDFKERRKKNQEMVDEYLNGRYVEKTQPSFRVLTRLAQGKRTLSGLSASERRYIRNVIGITDRKLRLFVAFKQADKIVPVYPTEVHDFESAQAIQNVELGNRNYRWLS